jgi:hypothetical protein
MVELEYEREHELGSPSTTKVAFLIQTHVTLHCSTTSGGSLLPWQLIGLALWPRVSSQPALSTSKPA